MTGHDFLSALRSVAQRVNLDLASPREGSVELDMGSLCPKMKKYFEWELGQSGHVESFLFWIIVGQVSDPRALIGLLRENNSGVGRSPFFAALMQDRQENWLVTLESRHMVPPTMSSKDLEGVLELVIVNPIFMKLAVDPPELPGIDLFV